MGILVVLLVAPGRVRFPSIVLEPITLWTIPGLLAPHWQLPLQLLGLLQTELLKLRVSGCIFVSLRLFGAYLCGG